MFAHVRGQDKLDNISSQIPVRIPAISTDNNKFWHAHNLNTK